ncbi:MAG TPA: YggS family pyridoxal phosphate-dependent enzyme [Euzebyales bacterium]|nr:YggS family pyridoxal phosphate-dependent enzyme [Euzebyales bacterium]
MGAVGDDGRVAARLAAVRRRIATAARAAGRLPDDVRLVAVSKFHPLDRIRAAFDAGQLEFGESRAQELDAKLAEDPPAELRWHFVGRLQRNKVRLVAGRVVLVHSVDRIRLADAIADHMASVGGNQDVLIQVNVTGEQRKDGCRPEDIEDLAERIAELPGVTATGLMAIPPLDVDPDAVFARLRALRAQVASGHPEVVELSMGMSGDLEVAIANGATIVRVGTDVFGPRSRTE